MFILLLNEVSSGTFLISPEYFYCFIKYIFGGFQDCAALILVVIESMAEVSVHFQKLCTDKFHFYKLHFTLQRNHTTYDKVKELVLHAWVS